MSKRAMLALRRSILACAALAAAPVVAEPTPSPSLPAYSWGYQPVGVDERGLWMMADELEREVRDSRLVLRDEPLSTYVRGVLCRAVGDDRCKGVRLYIMRDPSFNAAMAPNGMMMVNTGTLLRLHGEAELASVLAHEFGHFELRHQLASFRRQRSATDAMTWIGIAAGSNGGLVQLAIAGSFYSFKREEETEADIRSFEYLAASPYRAAVSAEMWARVMEERDATTAARKQTSNSRRGASFLDTHPAPIERMAYLKALASKRGNSGDDGIESYTKALASWRPQLLADQVKRNDFGGSEYILTTLARSGWTSDLLSARGDLYRLRGNPRDLAFSAQCYRDAIAQGASDPVVRRDLGLVLLRSGARGDAATALQQYLALRPDATDRTMVATLIMQAGPASQGGVMSAQATAPAAVPSGQATAPAGATGLQAQATVPASTPGVQAVAQGDAGVKAQSRPPVSAMGGVQTLAPKAEQAIGGEAK